MWNRLTLGIVVVLTLLLIATGIAASQLPSFGAGALLYPSRHVSTQAAPDGCVDRTFTGVDVTLSGWYCASPDAHSKGTIVYLHGVADNRASAVSAIRTLLPLGFNVVAYDSRAHGRSTGDRCTYGFFEKRDLQRVIEVVGDEHVILIGHSLGAAVALQAAAIEPRVKAVVAASTFSDLRTVATERVPYFPSWSLGPAFARAERDGQFVVDDVSPVRAAGHLAIPALIIHGADDHDTLPSHSERVFAALREPKRLIVVPGVGHNNALTPGVWRQIREWLLSSL